MKKLFFLDLSKGHNKSLENPSVLQKEQLGSQNIISSLLSPFLGVIAIRIHIH
jgi:hypothetical protein